MEKHKAIRREQNVSGGQQYALCLDAFLLRKSALPAPLQPLSHRAHCPLESAG